ncbi:MAG: hypothetical protein WBD41_18550 [Rhodococcus sp. (in: high G+C Gram-positive bacteria)]
MVDMQPGFVDGNGSEADRGRSVIDGSNTMAATAEQERKQVMALRQGHHGLIANSVIKAVGRNRRILQIRARSMAQNRVGEERLAGLGWTRAVLCSQAGDRPSTFGDVGHGAS